MFDFMRRKKDRTELAKILRTESAAERYKQKYNIIDFPVEAARVEGHPKKRTRPMSLQLSNSSMTDTDSSHTTELKRKTYAKRRSTHAARRSSLSVHDSHDDETSVYSAPTTRPRNRRQRTMSLSAAPSSHHSDPNPLVMSTTFRQNTNDSSYSATSSSALVDALDEFSLPASSINCVVAHTPVIISPTTSHVHRWFAPEIVDPDSTGVASPVAMEEEAPPPTYREVEESLDITESDSPPCDDTSIIDSTRTTVTIASMTSRTFRPTVFVQTKISPRPLSPLSAPQNMWVVS